MSYYPTNYPFNESSENIWIHPIKKEILPELTPYKKSYAEMYLSSTNQINLKTILIDNFNRIRPAVLNDVWVQEKANEVCFGALLAGLVPAVNKLRNNSTQELVTKGGKGKSATSLKSQINLTPGEYNNILAKYDSMLEKTFKERLKLDDKKSKDITSALGNLEATVKMLNNLMKQQNVTSKAALKKLLPKDANVAGISSRMGEAKSIMTKIDKILKTSTVDKEVSLSEKDIQTIDRLISQANSKLNKNLSDMNIGTFNGWGSNIIGDLFELDIAHMGKVVNATMNNLINEGGGGNKNPGRIIADVIGRALVNGKQNPADVRILIQKSMNQATQNLSITLPGKTTLEQMKPLIKNVEELEKNRNKNVMTKGNVNDNGLMAQLQNDMTQLKYAEQKLSLKSSGIKNSKFGDIGNLDNYINNYLSANVNNTLAKYVYFNDIATNKNDYNKLSISYVLSKQAETLRDHLIKSGFEVVISKLVDSYINNNVTMVIARNIGIPTDVLFLSFEYFVMNSFKNDAECKIRALEIKKWIKKIEDAIKQNANNYLDLGYYIINVYGVLFNSSQKAINQANTFLKDNFTKSKKVKNSKDVITSVKLQTTLAEKGIDFALNIDTSRIPNINTPNDVRLHYDNIIKKMNNLNITIRSSGK